MGLKRKGDKFEVGEDEWLEAVAREAIVKPLAGEGRLSPTEVAVACRALGLRRARLCALIDRYRGEPVTSSMLAAKPGPARGARRLADDVEALIEEAISGYYLKRQKPSVSALHDPVRQLCRARSVAAPSRKAIQARVASIDRRVLVGAREGAKAARDGFKPVVAQYRADHALHVVQIDHTLVDIFVVDRAPSADSAPLADACDPRREPKGRRVLSQPGGAVGRFGRVGHPPGRDAQIRLARGSRRGGRLAGLGPSRPHSPRQREGVPRSGA